jgi:hypothetical protein
MIHCWSDTPVIELRKIIDLFEQSLIQVNRCVFCHEQEYDTGSINHKKSCEISRARDLLTSLLCGDD